MKMRSQPLRRVRLSRVPKSVWSNLTARERHDLELHRLILMRRSPPASALAALSDVERHFVKLNRKRQRLWNQLMFDHPVAFGIVLKLLQLGDLQGMPPFQRLTMIAPTGLWEAKRLSAQREAARQGVKPRLRLVR